MKVYSISQWTFGGICLLILSLPISRHWKLLTAGEKARGTVMEYTLLLQETGAGDRVPGFASEISFPAGGMTFTTFGPINVPYEPGRTVRIRYDEKDPTDNCLVTFTGLYLSNYTILPVILLVLWAAFYLSYNNYSKRSVRD